MDDEEIEKFIKRAKISLGANGSRYVSYSEFLNIYKKDNHEDFETQARCANYRNGREALAAYPEFFELTGDLVRRMDTENISHIMAAIDRSKSRKRRPAKKTRPFSSQPSKNFTSFYERQAKPPPKSFVPSQTRPGFKNYRVNQGPSTSKDYRPDYSSRGGHDFHQGYNDRLNSKNRQNGYSDYSGRGVSYERGYDDGYYRSNKTHADVYDNGYYDNEEVYNAYPSSNHRESNPPFKNSRSYYKHPDDEKYDRPSKFHTNDNTYFEDGLEDFQSTTSYKNNKEGGYNSPQKASFRRDFAPNDRVGKDHLSSSKFDSSRPLNSYDVNGQTTEGDFGIPNKPKQHPSSSNAVSKLFNFDNRTLDNVMETVGRNIFKMIQDIHEQGKRAILKPEKLVEILKVHQLDLVFSLNQLKCFLSNYLPKSFHIIPVNEDSFSIKSKNDEAPKSEYQFICHLTPRKIKPSPQLQLKWPYPCRILGADNMGGYLVVYLRPYHWDQAYASLQAELRRYATMIDLLNPLKIVFKSDNALFFDEETRKFYRCLVISGNENSVDILLSDEFKKRVVNTDSLYKLPGRFYRFHYMSFMLNSANIPSEHRQIITDQLRKCATKEHQVEVTIENSEGYKDGVTAYAGELGKITTIA